MLYVTISVVGVSEAFIVGFLRTHPHQHEHINIDYKFCVQSLCDFNEPDNESWSSECTLIYTLE